MMKQKYQRTKQNNNVLSIISIGLESYVDVRCEPSEITKAFSAKSIKYDQGINQRMNTLSTNPANTQSSKINKLLKNIISPPEIDNFSDTNQYRHPVLKVKKTGGKNSNKIQEFINKIAYQGKPNIEATYGKKSNINYK